MFKPFTLFKRNPTGKPSLGFSLSTKRTLQILFGIGLATVIAGELAVRVHIERAYQAALKNRQRLETRLIELQAEREQLVQALSQEQQRVEGLTQELSAKDRELQHTLARLSEEQQTIETLEQRVGAMRRQMDLLQGELALALQPRTGSSTASSQAVQLEKVVVAQPTPSPATRGRVLSVHPDWKFVVIDVGWDFVRIGDIISISRRDQLLGKARVERVQEEAAAATLLPEWEHNEIAVNDVVDFR